MSSAAARLERARADIESKFDTKPVGETVTPCKADEGRKTVASAIEAIRKSDFGKTEEGKKVLAKIAELEKSGAISYGTLPAGTRGSWGKDGIKVNDAYVKDVDATASELVHEATHALNEDEFPASKTQVTIDEELRTNANQVSLYKEQRAGGFRDPELERRMKAEKDGKLRDDVRKRYPGVPESLP